MDAKRLGNNSFGLAELSKITAPIMVATSPNIGAKGYLKRPKNIQNLIHIFHSIADIAFYKKYSLDHYDTVILVGDFQRKSIRIIEELRNLKQKELQVLGLPYLDDLYQNLAHNEAKNNESTTILIGSSWGEKGCLKNYGTEFIKDLAAAGFSLVIRPHPYSFVVEPQFIEQCKQETASLPLVRWDDDISPAKAMAESHILVSDTSSLRFDYAFLYEKPVISLDIPVGSLTEFEANELEENWNDTASAKIGETIDLATINELPKIVNKVLATDKAKEIQSFREETVINFGNCSSHIISYLSGLVHNAKH